MKSLHKSGSLLVALLMISMALAACDSNNAAAPTAVTAATKAPAMAATNSPMMAAATSTPAMAMTSTSMMTPTAAPVIVGEKGSKGVIKIAVDLPTSGADASDGIPTRNGVQLAIEEANKAGEVLPGYKLEMYALDDAVNGVHNPQQGASNAQAFIADNDVIAMVGPFNSNVARAIMPIMNDANVAHISPSNTNEKLTKPEFGETTTYRPTGIITYFRVCTTDDIQGPAAANYAFDKLGAKSVYILDDQEAYGKGISDNFEKQFKSKGGTILGHDGVPKGTTDFGTIVPKVAATNPALVFYGGTTSNGVGLFRKQMKDKMANVPLMGGDGIVEQQMADDAGDNSTGVYGTVAAVNAETLPEAKAFLTNYKARFNANVGSYSANGYEAANIIIAAIKAKASKWKDGNQVSNREAVRAAVAATKDFKGVTGSTSFDANGDTTNKYISIYKIEGGAFKFIDQIKFGGQ